MTSETAFISTLIDKNRQSLLEHSPTNGTLSTRLLSPIIENSAEILPGSVSISGLSLDALEKSTNFVLTNENSTIDELNHQTIQRLHEYFLCVKTYLEKLDVHFAKLSIITEGLRDQENFSRLIEPIETRLLQIRAKRNQIIYLLDQASMKNIWNKISQCLTKSKLNIDYNELFTSIHMSMKLKTTLIDHLNNEQCHMRCQISEHSSKLQRRQELLYKLKRHIAVYIMQQKLIAQQVHNISIINVHNRHCIELMNLSDEYEQLQHENYLLTVNAKENLQRLSMIMQSNHCYILEKSH